MTTLSWLVYVRGFGNGFCTRTVLTSWCEEFLLTLQCWPLCTVQTFNSSHAAGLGAMYTILNAYKGMVGLKMKPEMVLSVLHVIYSSPLHHVFYKKCWKQKFYFSNKISHFLQKSILSCVFPPATCY